ncbi:MAG: hypothetical protein WA921_08855 [Ahrensia sp.]
MRILSKLAAFARGTKNFVWPDYQPERYYMRGKGPAFAKRHNLAAD